MGCGGKDGGDCLRVLVLFASWKYRLKVSLELGCSAKLPPDLKTGLLGRSLKGRSQKGADLLFKVRRMVVPEDPAPQRFWL